ncbi:MAG: AAA family ATPase [Nitrososphaerales archaeon]|nr:AAA family ATPase [Nitrososphaerales archaeon]
MVCITGMPGSGKSTVAKGLQKIDFEVVNMGDVIREEVMRRGLELNDKNMGETMKAVRRELGMGAVAKLCLPKIHKSDSKYIAIDGIRSMHEVEVFKQLGEVRLLAIHASPDRRFQLLKKRGRLDDPESWKDFQRRDRRELDVGIGEAIALADEVISNNDVTKRKLQNEALKVVKRWLASFENPAISTSG